MTGRAKAVLERLSPRKVLALAALIVGAGCAHKAVSADVQATKDDAESAIPKVRFVSEEIGVSIDVPANLGFVAGENLGVLATASDSTELRVFMEHLAVPATERACWERIHRRAGRLLDSPRDVDELIALATAGVPRADRVVYLSVYPKANRCYVLVGEGPKTSTTLPAAIGVARKSVAVGPPSRVMAVEFEIDAGMQQLDTKEYEAAVASFERALAIAPESPRAQFGAGLAAYFAGAAHADKAIKHLSAVAALSRNDEMAPPLRPEQIRDTLMYLGLAYATKHEYGRATSTLAELVARTPGDATGRYNLACVLALSGDSDTAFGELEDALEKDPTLIAHAQEDDDLKSLRGLPAWAALFQRLSSSPAGRRH